jgi:branched-chain amino acid transport system substrate-binding protein
MATHYRKIYTLFLMLTLLAVMAAQCVTEPTAEPAEAPAEVPAQEEAAPPAEEEAAPTDAPAAAAEEGMAEEGPIVIGLHAPLTGPNAQFGAAMRDGAELAVAGINEQGGINGRPVELVVGDDKSDPAEGVAVVQRFLADNQVVGMLGGFNSSVNLATQEKTGEAGIVHLNMGASPRLSQDETGNSTLFRAILTDKIFVPATAEYIVKDLGLSRIAMIGENTDYGLAEMDTMVELAPELGAEIVAQESFNPGDTDFSAQLAKISQTDPEAVMVAGLISEAALIAQQSEAVGLEAQLFSPSDGVDSPQFIELGGEAVDGYVFASMIDLERETPEVQTFRALAEGAGIDVQAYVAITYDAANVLFEAFKAVGTDGPAVADYLKQTELEGVTGLIAFDEVGDRASPPFIRQVQGGQFVTVKAPGE